jgi:hypothetical protein
VSSLLTALGKTEANLMVPSTSPDGDGLRIGLWAEEGAGKTHFYLSRPGDVVIFDFEHNINRVLPKFPGKETVHFKYPTPLDGEMSTAFPIAERFRKEYFKTLDDLDKAKIGPKDVSLVIDSGSGLWDLLQTAYVRKDENGKAPPKDFERVNAMYRSVLVEAAMRNQVLFVTSRAPLAWGMVDNGKGGQMLAELTTRKATWNKHSPYDLDIVIELQRADKIVAGKRVNTRSYLVKKCTPNDKLYGKRLEDLFGGPPGGPDGVDYRWLMDAVAAYDG